jgi:hypothetical protein
MGLVDFAHPTGAERADDLKPPGKAVTWREHKACGVGLGVAGARGEQTRSVVVLHKQRPDLSSEKHIVAAGGLQVELAFGGFEFYGVVKVFSNPLPLKFAALASLHGQPPGTTSVR